MKKLIIASIVIVVVVVVGYWYIRREIVGAPIDYSTESHSSAFNEQFKYGSIGSDAGGLPLKIWRVLPIVFKDLLPDKGASGQGYAAFGLLYEDGKDIPVGISIRKGFVDTVGLNCASCHAGSVRETSTSVRRIITTMPAHQFDLGRYFNFLFACAHDPGFTKDNLMNAIQHQGHLGFIEKMVLPDAIDKTKQALLDQEKALSYMKVRPEMGPGRVDTFNPYKVLFLKVDMTNDKTIGTADFPAIWQQDIKKDLFMHWDGNNNSIDERNISAALGAGANPKTVDLARINRIRDWLMVLPKTDYPFEIDANLASVGQGIYKQNCAECHELGGAKFGEVTPVQELGTDPHRVDSFDLAMAQRMNTLGEGYPWRFTHFRKTNGYANRPLDGIWARGPYLHNGSVPTLRELLETPDKRRAKFYRGYDVFDKKDVGFIADVQADGGRRFFEYDTTKDGNANTGHTYGAALSESEKLALLEYLKTK